MDVAIDELMDDADDELKDDAVSALVLDVESVFPDDGPRLFVVTVEADPVVAGLLPVLGTVTAEAMSVSASLGFAVSVALVGKFCTGAGSKFV